MPRCTLLLLGFLFSGCAMQARLYDLDAGSVLQATYMGGLGRGSITIHHPEGECRGEFSTVVGGSWGQIYATGSGGAYASGTSMGMSLANRGAAVATCPGGRTIECEYVASMGSGNGFCRDNRNTRYRLMF
jgi:hypothetical protein